MKSLFSLTVFLLLSLCSIGQELNCNVLVDAARVQSQETQIFEEMQFAIQEFMNTTTWTEDQFEAQEKIQCNISIQILSGSVQSGSYTATAQIQSNRPVYNTDYNSIVFNYVDKEFNFNYLQGTALDYGENQFNSDLTSLLAFYAHVMIGLDYDSFSLNGGAEFFEKAQNIFLTAQSSGGDIWNNQDDVNGKFSLMNDFINTQLASVHENIYKYHRNALDTFTKDPQASLAMVIQILDDMLKQRELVAFSIWINSFFFAKSDELIKLFEEADQAQKSRAKALLIQLDARNRSKYENKLK